MISKRDVVRATPVLYSNVGSLNSWSFGEPVSARQGGRVVSIYSSPGENTAPLIQLAGDNEPCLVAPYGLKSPAEGATSNRFNLELTVTHEPLNSFLASLDAHFRDVATEKCSKWFSKTLKKEEIESLQRPLLSKATMRVPHDLLRVKVPPSVRVWRVSPSSSSSNDSAWTYSIGSIEDVTQGCSCWITVSVSSLYFLPRLFGCTFTAQDLLIFPEPDNPSPFPFLTTVRIVEQKEEKKEESTTALVAPALEI